MFLTISGDLIILISLMIRILFIIHYSQPWEPSQFEVIDQLIEDESQLLIFFLYLFSYLVLKLHLLFDTL